MKIIYYLIGFAILFVPFVMWTDRNLDFWLSHFAEKTVDVPWWASALVTLFGNGLVIVGNLIAEIARFCL